MYVSRYVTWTKFGLLPLWRDSKITSIYLSIYLSIYMPIEAIQLLRTPSRDLASLGITRTPSRSGL